MWVPSRGALPCLVCRPPGLTARRGAGPPRRRSRSLSPPRACPQRPCSRRGAPELQRRRNRLVSPARCQRRPRSARGLQHGGARHRSRLEAGTEAGTGTRQEVTVNGKRDCCAVYACACPPSRAGATERCQALAQTNRSTLPANGDGGVTCRVSIVACVAPNNPAYTLAQQRLCMARPPSRHGHSMRARPILKFSDPACRPSQVAAPSTATPFHEGTAWRWPMPATDQQ